MTIDVLPLAVPIAERRAGRAEQIGAYATAELLRALLHQIYGLEDDLRGAHQLWSYLADSGATITWPDGRQVSGATMYQVVHACCGRSSAEDA